MKKCSNSSLTWEQKDEILCSWADGKITEAQAASRLGEPPLSYIRRASCDLCGHYHGGLCEADTAYEAYLDRLFDD